MYIITLLKQRTTATVSTQRTTSGNAAGYRLPSSPPSSSSPLSEFSGERRLSLPGSYRAVDTSPRSYWLVPYYVRSSWYR